jgi:glyoxylase-like metal-dependent hydrolase (beta-lactamase superfamily II)
MLLTRIPRNPVVSVAALCMLGAANAQAQPAAVELDILPVQGSVYMLHAGAAGNIALQIGKDGVVAVNALRAGMAERIAAEVKTLTPAPIRYIINTSADLHNTAGNAELAALGVFGATNASGRPGATLVAHENVLQRLTLLTRARQNPFPELAVPQDVYILPFKDLYFNGEPIFVMHEANAHSDGDSIVLFRKSDTIAVGDLFTPNEYPVIDVASGGSINGLLRALHHILDLAVPEHLQDGGTRIIPGKGRLCNEADVVEYRNMVAIIRDRVRAMIDGGMKLDAIQAARPTRDYDTEYGSGGRVFVESIYASLTAAQR